MSSADRAHSLLDSDLGGAYYRFRAVHDLIGHVATGYEFDRDGEYSAWVVQRHLYTGLARWAAATELHGEISALWATGQFAEGDRDRGQGPRAGCCWVVGAAGCARRPG
jgi:hypothetical protein